MTRNLSWKARRIKRTANNDWRLMGGSRAPSLRGFGLLGILNLTPDSFYDGGKYNNLSSAVARVGQLLAEGANIIDIGAESTRPGSRPVGLGEERERLFAALSAIRKCYPEAVLSVDTRNSQIAEAALACGCQIINDVSACRHDPQLLDVLASYKPGYVLMHAQGKPETMQINPQYEDVVDTVRRFFEFWLSKLIRAGLPEDRIVLDPGIGFGKRSKHNLRLLKEIERLAEFGRPVLAGISMKSSLAEIFPAKVGRGDATVMLSAWLYCKGVTWHRVHEPGRVGAGLLRAKAILQGGAYS